MAAQRLPWVKFWVEALEHEKCAALSDSESWTWIVLLARASQQPKRWRFASLEHAAKVSGRKPRHIERLIELRLIDRNDDGSLTIHDAKQWQETANITPSARERSSNADDSVTQHQSNADDSLTENAPNSDRDIDRDIEKDDVDAAVASSPDFAQARETNGGGNGHVHDFALRRTRPPPIGPDLPQEVLERLRRPPIGNSSRKEQP